MHLLGTLDQGRAQPGHARRAGPARDPALGLPLAGRVRARPAGRSQPGDVVRVTCRYDASRADAAAATPRYILWGEGTTDEMCLGILQVTRGRRAPRADPPRLADVPGPEAPGPRRVRRGARARAARAATSSSAPWSTGAAAGCATSRSRATSRDRAAVPARRRLRALPRPCRPRWPRSRARAARRHRPRPGRRERRRLARRARRRGDGPPGAAVIVAVSDWLRDRLVAPSPRPRPRRGDRLRRRPRALRARRAGSARERRLGARGDGVPLRRHARPSARTCSGWPARSSGAARARSRSSATGRCAARSRAGAASTSPARPARRRRRWLAAADVVCQPSLVEPFGLATLEAMASGARWSRRRRRAARVRARGRRRARRSRGRRCPRRRARPLPALRARTPARAPPPSAHDVRRQAERIEELLERAAGRQPPRALRLCADGGCTVAPLARDGVHRLRFVSPSTTTVWTIHPRTAPSVGADHVDPEGRRTRCRRAPARSYAPGSATSR